MIKTITETETGELGLVNLFFFKWRNEIVSKDRDATRGVVRTALTSDWMRCQR